MTFASCTNNSPTAPPEPSSTTSTTTTSTSTTTTTAGPGPTTTTTTTTAGNVDYATQVHPIWGAQGCAASGCHSSPGPAPTLSGSPTDSCNSIASRDATNANLVITGGGEAGSEILTKPNPAGISHAGGGFACFGGAGANCYDTVLLWLQQGAMGPGGGTCGS